eukprot:scaffold2205_cov183-Ochromonas_danica.AAC.29
MRFPWLDRDEQLARREDETVRPVDHIHISGQGSEVLSTAPSTTGGPGSPTRRSLRGPVEIELDGEAFLQQKQQKKKKKTAPMPKSKLSPYIADLQEEMKAKRVHAKPPVAGSGAAAVAARGGGGQKRVGGQDNAKAKASSKPPRPSPAPRAPVPTPAPSSSSAAPSSTGGESSKGAAQPRLGLRESIAAELAELGLGPPVVSEKKAPARSVPTSAHNKGESKKKTVSEKKGPTPTPKVTATSSSAAPKQPILPNIAKQSTNDLPPPKKEPIVVEEVPSDGKKLPALPASRQVPATAVQKKAASDPQRSGRHLYHSIIFLSLC